MVVVEEQAQSLLGKVEWRLNQRRVRREKSGRDSERARANGEADWGSRVGSTDHLISFSEGPAQAMGLGDRLAV
jgi:hypothetical protein